MNKRTGKENEFRRCSRIRRINFLINYYELYLVINSFSYGDTRLISRIVIYYKKTAY